MTITLEQAAVAEITRIVLDAIHEAREVDNVTFATEAVRISLEAGKEIYHSLNLSEP